MRRKERKVSAISEIISIMKKCDSCVLSMNNGKYPYSVPINFAVKQNTDSTISIYFHGANTGTKLSLLQKDRHVSFAMSCSKRLVEGNPACLSTIKYESVCGTGKVRILEKELDEKCLALSELMKHHFPGSDHVFTPKEASSVAVLRLDVDTISGKRNL